MKFSVCLHRLHCGYPGHKFSKEAPNKKALLNLTQDKVYFVLVDILALKIFCLRAHSFML